MRLTLVTTQWVSGRMESGDAGDVEFPRSSQWLWGRRGLHKSISDFGKCLTNYLPSILTANLCWCTLKIVIF